MQILAWTQKHLQKSVCEHSSVRYLQMQVNEAVSCKDKAICEHNPETPWSVLKQLTDLGTGFFCKLVNLWPL